MAVRTCVLPVALAIAVTSATTPPTRQAPDRNPGVSQFGPLRIPVAGPQTEGSQHAPIGLVEFCDFEAFGCQRFAKDILPKLRQLYVSKGVLLIAFFHFPLTAVYPHSQLAATVTACAGLSGNFWRVHDKLFADPRDLSYSRLLQTARAEGIPTEELERCAKADGPQVVGRQQALGRELGVMSVPTIFIGRLDNGWVRAEDRLLESGAVVVSDAVKAALRRSGR